MKKGGIGTYIFGAWAILTGCWYLISSIKMLMPFLFHLREADPSAINHNAMAMVILLGIVTLFVVIGVSLIKIKRFALYLLTFIFIIQFFYSAFIILFVSDEPYFLEMNLSKIIYLIWFLALPLIGLVYVTRKGVKKLFGVSKVI